MKQIDHKKIIARIIQITDSHLLGETKKNFLGINPYKHLTAIVKDAKQYQLSDRPTMLFFTGDISQDYSLTSYELAFSTVSQLNLPLAAVAGNHDNINALTEIASKYHVNASKSLNYDNWQIILLNSHWPNHVAGKLDQQELIFLQQEINNNHNKNIMIFVHHHSLPLNAAWLDKHILVNSDQFLSLIAQQQNIKAVFCGHIHQESFFKYHNTNFYSTPAVAWQFAPNHQTFQFDTQMPGYRIIDLYNDGEYLTKVIRLAYNEEFIPDLKSTGY